ncbi:hypothetical protein B0H63DRAFT_483378 [Podospora didyma]|uniref:MFS maltose permease n=1 Tax=Podospora didyma TaxID=330526 RepID=A0AAE0K965_9PEZI|nr:hypothetical protein B0H63DRAFT_483378 [Podospora didyma]
MRPRLLMLRRTLLGRPSKLPSPRFFAQSTVVRAGLRTRPQLPFLSVPNTTRGSRSSNPHQQQFRYLTTERKAQWKHDIKLGIKWTTYGWLAMGFLATAAFAISQESLERQYPTPHEWSFGTRMRFRGAFCERDQTDPTRITDPLAIIQWIKGAVERLEDPKIDGKGLKDAPPSMPPGTKDIRAMSEPWRRGYYEAMMMYAKAAENVDGWVRDKTRNMVFPPGSMIGPSNPRPRPLPPGLTGAPREENCELAYESPDDIYLRILSTEGLTPRQRMDAGLAYASWLDFKGIAGPAAIMYEDAVEMAARERDSLPVEPLDRTAWTLNEAAGQPSANLLKSLTAFATFKARNGHVSSALPILVSILKARRNLPSETQTSLVSQISAAAREASPHPQISNPFQDALNTITGFFAPPAYPPPPADGTAPPIRDAKELCEEAALSLHIGEIMYTANAASREEGLGWTREAVDVAEEQLHKLSSSAVDKDARTTCRDCLASGLDNWATMVARLAKEETAKRDAAGLADAAAAAKPSVTSGGGWFSLWGGETKKKEDLSRWAAEEKVIVDRQRRVKELLDELEPPANGLSSIFSA